MRLILLIVMMLFSSSALAGEDDYFCWRPADALDNLRDADAVFTGKVLQIESWKADKNELNTPRINVYFEVANIWKGIPAGERYVQADTESKYKYRFEKDQEYLVYAYNMYPVDPKDPDGQKRLTMVGCPRVKQVGDVRKDLLWLGRPINQASEMQKLLEQHGLGADGKAISQVNPALESPTQPDGEVETTPSNVESQAKEIVKNAEEKINKESAVVNKIEPVKAEIPKKSDVASEVKESKPEEALEKAQAMQSKSEASEIKTTVSESTDITKNVPEKAKNNLVNSGELKKLEDIGSEKSVQLPEAAKTTSPSPVSVPEVKQPVITEKQEVPALNPSVESLAQPAVPEKIVSKPVSPATVAGPSAPPAPLPPLDESGGMPVGSKVNKTSEKAEQKKEIKSPVQPVNALPSAPEAFEPVPLEEFGGGSTTFGN